VGATGYLFNYNSCDLDALGGNKKLQFWRTDTGGKLFTVKQRFPSLVLLFFGLVWFGLVWFCFVVLCCVMDFIYLIEDIRICIII